MREVRLNLWTILLGASGVTSKSSTAETIYDLVLGKMDDLFYEEFKKEQETYNLLSKEEKIDNDPPRKQQIKVGQTSTFQGVIKTLENNQHGLLYYADEAFSILQKMNKNAELKADLTSIYSEKDFYKVLVGSHGRGEVISIKRPFLSMIMLSTPVWFYKYIQKDGFLSGYFARFTIYEMTQNVPRNTKLLKKQDFSKFQDTTLKVYKNFQQYSNYKPFEMELTEEAFERYVQWQETIKSYDQTSTYDENITQPESINASLNRIQNKVFKYAAILQIYDAFYTEKVLEPKITLQYIEYAIKIAENDIRNILQVMSKYDSVIDPVALEQRNEENAKVIHRYLSEYAYEEENMICESQVIKNNTRLKKNPALAKDVLDLVVKNFSVRRVQKQVRKKNVNYYYAYGIDL